MNERGSEYWSSATSTLAAVLSKILTFNAFNTIFLDRSVLARLFQELHNGVYQGLLIVSCHCVCCERRNVSRKISTSASHWEKEWARKKKIVSACGGPELGIALLALFNSKSWVFLFVCPFTIRSPAIHHEYKINVYWLQIRHAVHHVISSDYPPVPG